jgi:hypothetical protein
MYMALPGHVAPLCIPLHLFVPTSLVFYKNDTNNRLLILNNTLLIEIKLYSKF